MDDQPTITTLIADDEIDMRHLVRLIIELANEGLQVIGEAADGEEALSMWRDMDPPPIPSVVLLDNRMPGLSGMEVAERIFEEYPDQKVILFSAYLDDKVRRAAAELGIDECVAKNEVEKLPDVIRRLLEV